MDDNFAGMIDPVKLVNNKLNIPNPRGKGGFGDNPQNINRNGRKLNEFSWTRLLEDTAKNMDYMNELDLKRLVVKKLFMMAIDGNVPAMKEIFNRTEGRPRRPKI